MTGSLSDFSRWLTRAMAVAYGLLGLVLFVLPAWSAAVPVGRLALRGHDHGGMVHRERRAGLAVRGHLAVAVDPSLPAVPVDVRPPGGGGAGVVPLEGRPGRGLAWPYALTLALTVAAAVASVAGLVRQGPDRDRRVSPRPAGSGPCGLLRAVRGVPGADRRDRAEVRPGRGRVPGAAHPVHPAGVRGLLPRAAWGRSRWCEPGPWTSRAFIGQAFGPDGPRLQHHPPYGGETPRAEGDSQAPTCTSLFVCLLEKRKSRLLAMAPSLPQRGASALLPRRLDSRGGFGVEPVAAGTPPTVAVAVWASQDWFGLETLTP
jgi:hypothetical protein